MKNLDAEAVVQGQVEAYNDHDVEKFASFYSDEITIYDLSGDKPTAKDKGIAALKKTYAWMAEAPPGFGVEIIKRIVNGPIVVDLERIQGLPEEKGTPEFLAIYEVRDGKIINVWFPPEP